MNCTEFDHALDAAVESRSPVDSALREHARACRRCGDRWEQFAILDRAISDWRIQLPEVDLADAVLARMAFDNPASRTTLSVHSTESKTARGRARPLAAITICATALVVACLVILTPGHSPGPSNSPGDDTAIVETAPPAAEPAEPIDVALRDAGSAWLALANQTAEAVTEAGTLRPSPDVLAEVEAPAPPTRRWYESLGEDLKPIGANVENAAGFLIEAVSINSPSTL